MQMHSIGDSLLWSVFFMVVAVVFCVDLFVFSGRKSHVIKPREAWTWFSVWVSCACLFGLFIWWHIYPLVGPVIAKQKTLEFFTAYVIEESLSVDNMFVILLIFKSFAVPLQWQRRVLLYGVLGAIVMRVGVIFVGAWLIKEFHWIIYLFGVFLVWSGGKIFFVGDHPANPADNKLLQWITKHIRVTKKFHAENFFVKKNKLWYATPLFLALILVEITDLVFAIDSIPAVFAVTLDQFIVVTSNIFAVLGLRALYFVVADLDDRFSGIKYGVALVLILTGVKMLLQPWYKLPILPMLLLVVVILFVAGITGWFLGKNKSENNRQ